MELIEIFELDNVFKRTKRFSINKNNFYFLFITSFFKRVKKINQ